MNKLVDINYFFKSNQYGDQILQGEAEQFCALNRFWSSGF